MPPYRLSSPDGELWLISTMSASVDRRSRPLLSAYNFALIAALAVICGLAAAYAIDAARRVVFESETSMDPGTEVVRTMSGRDLTIPAAWLRHAEQRVDGIARQIDLRLRLPLGPQGASRTVDVTLLPRSSVRPSASLLDGVYLHMFRSSQLEGPVGLVGKPLEAREGYAEETVWYDPLSPHPFVAKCAAPIAPGVSGRCLRTVALASGLAAAYSFDANLLDNWRRFDAAIHPALQRIGALQ